MRRPSKGVLLFVATAISAQAGLAPFARRAEALVIPLTFDQMTQRSKYVLTGEVVAIRSYRAPFKDLGEVMFTDVTIRIASVLKGAPGGQEITVQVLGGEIGTAFQKCLESARYEKGEKVLVFLRDYNDAIWNTGWLQGKYRLDPGGTVVKGSEELPIARDVALSTVEAQVRALSVSTPPAPSTGGAPVKEGGAK